VVETLVLVSLFLTVFGHIIKEGRLEKEGKLQRSLHKLYAVLEPSLLRFLDRMMTSEIIGGTRIGRVILKILSKILWVSPSWCCNRLHSSRASSNMDRFTGELTYRNRSMRV